MGQEWNALIGDGWIFRILPIDTPVNSPARSDAQRYTGWDLVIDREQGGGYPDALLLGTPPYGSLTEREIGTTFGLRAQDAIAWGPRRFHFMTSATDLAQGRDLYRSVFTEVSPKAGDRAASGQNRATDQLLALLNKGSWLGKGEFSVLDARLVAGTADPAPFARQWAMRLGQVPHTMEQSPNQSNPRGELRWIRFKVTLWLPASWNVSPKWEKEAATCAE
jgi:hypothetical protein